MMPTIMIVFGVMLMLSPFMYPPKIDAGMMQGAKTSLHRAFNGPVRPADPEMDRLLTKLDDA